MHNLINIFVYVNNLYFITLYYIIFPKKIKKNFFYVNFIFFYNCRNELKEYYNNL